MVESIKNHQLYINKNPRTLLRLGRFFSHTSNSPLKRNAVFWWDFLLRSIQRSGCESFHRCERWIDEEIRRKRNPKQATTTPRKPWHFDLLSNMKLNNNNNNNNNGIYFVSMEKHISKKNKEQPITPGFFVFSSGAKKRSF